MNTDQSVRKADIRKIVVQVEETHKEQGIAVSQKMKVTVAGVIKNPFAGEYHQDLEPLYDLGKDISGILAERGVQALGVEPNDVSSYGKAAIVGVNGEIEHTAAILHPRFGAQLPGVKAVVFNLSDETSADVYDGISELWFDTQADFEAAYASEIGQCVAQDSLNHVGGRVRLFVTEHQIVPFNE